MGTDWAEQTLAVSTQHHRVYMDVCWLNTSSGSKTNTKLWVKFTNPVGTTERATGIGY